MRLLACYCCFDSPEIYAPSHQKPPSQTLRIRKLPRVLQSRRGRLYVLCEDPGSQWRTVCPFLDRVCPLHLDCYVELINVVLMLNFMGSLLLLRSCSQLVITRPVDPSFFLFQLKRVDCFIQIWVT